MAGAALDDLENQDPYLGIARVTVGVADLQAARSFIEQGLGLVTLRELALDSGLQGGQSDQPRPAVDLGVIAYAMGVVRLAFDPQAESTPPPASLDQRGPYSLTFYTRDLDRRLVALDTLGFDVGEGVQAYTLPGTDHEVLEATVVGPGGLVIALVAYSADRHRCALNLDSTIETSELITVGHVVANIDDALVVLRDLMGGQVYFDGTFGGTAAAAMSGVAPDDHFRVVMIRSRDRANARFEIIERPASAPRSSGTASRHLTVTILVRDLVAFERRASGSAASSRRRVVARNGSLMLKGSDGLVLSFVDQIEPTRT